MDSLNKKWDALLLKLQKDIAEDIDLKGVLFLIGVQELQKGIQDFTKEEKQDILHLAVCKLLTSYGYFKFEKVDEDGWPHWEELKPIKNLTGEQQDLLIKEAIIAYFA
jgi:hypothetical protein|tara:strand:- start:234 stop:557 length:324 start_codon:yes stop_codon:yes gene_type:complete